MHRTPASTAALALLVGFALFAGCACAVVAGTDDVAGIYGSFLDSWTGEQKDPLNVSMSTELPSAEDLERFSDCVGKDSGTHWLPAEPIADLGNSIGGLSYVRLVDPDGWSPRDPGKAIAQGQSVQSAVESGFAHGLLTFSAIAFDESQQTAAFTYSFMCGALCGNGGAVIFKKTPAGWVRSDSRCGSWISQIQRGGPGNPFKPRPQRRG